MWGVVSLQGGGWGMRMESEKISWWSSWAWVRVDWEPLSRICFWMAKRKKWEKRKICLGKFFTDAGTSGRSSFDRLAVSSRSSHLAHLSYLKWDETVQSCLVAWNKTSSILQDLTVMTISNHLTRRFLILNGHGQKIMNRDEIKRDENGRNMFTRQWHRIGKLVE